MRRRRGQSGKPSKPTRNDVAKLAGTSGSTVSRVFSAREDIPIATETRAKIIEAARQLGYVPNQTARALTKGRTGVVAFWICLEYSRYRAQVLDAMRTVLGPSKMALTVANVDEEYWRDHSFSRTFRTSVDGIIAFDSSVSLIAFANPGGIAPRTPFVSMGAIWSEALSYVGIDLRAGTEAAMRHLFETGRRSIAFLVPGSWQLDASGPRAEVYRSAMMERGAPVDTILTDGSDLASIKSALAERMRRSRLPEALFCINDDVAISAGRALASLGVRVGHDVAIVGCDGIRETEEEACPLTTIQQPMEAMCALAVEYLKAQIDDPSAPFRRCVLKPELVVRDSTRLGARPGTASRCG